MQRIKIHFLIALLVPFTLVMGGGIWGGIAQHTHRSADQGGVISWIPTGFVGCYAGSTPPTNTVEAYGQAVSRVTYSKLFSQIGTAHGTGDGSTTFNLPDLRGRVMVGMDNLGGSAAGRITSASLNGANSTTLGGTGGAQTHTLVPAELNFSFGGPAGTGVTSATFGIDTASPFLGGSTYGQAVTFNGGGHNNTQPWIALKCVIGT